MHSLSYRIFHGDSEPARLCRSMDWSRTPLGPIESWPISLRTTAAMVVAAPAPMVVLWGAELVQIYNDGYRQLMGRKHPAGLGQPAHECWPEVREFTAPLYENVVSGRESFTFQDQAFVIHRHSEPETAYFTLTVSPVLDDAGEVGGLLTTVAETTAAVERALAEQACNEKEERLRIALQAADLGTWDLDLVNDQASSRSLRHDQIFGYETLQPEWGQRIALHHMLSEDRPNAERAFAEAEETGTLAFEARVCWPDDSVHWISVLGRTYYDSKGRPVRMAGVVADVTEQHRIDTLRESEERVRLMADTIPQLVWVTDANGENEFFNRQFKVYTGQEEPATTAKLAKKVVHPDDVAATLQSFEEARRKGEAFRAEHRIRSAEGEYRWFLACAEPYRDPASGEISRWFGASVDIHDRKLAEATLRQAAQVNAFRVGLDNALRPLVDPVEIQAAATRELGEHLRATRVLYAEVSADRRSVTIRDDYCRGVQSVAGVHQLADLGPDFTEELNNGRSLVQNNLSTDPRYSPAQRGTTAGFEVRARVVVPLVKKGRFVAALVVHQSEPRAWTDTEVTATEETAERTWAAVERAKTENALRESESKYRTLFESMDQAFGVVEVIYHADSSPTDFRWLETNPAFEQHTGIFASADKTVRELLPDLEQCWFDIYGQVAKTGEPARFVQKSPAVGRWFDVNAFPFGDPEKNQVAVLFSDITERKEAEAAIERANARLIESDRRKDEFLAMLAHELRNPLAAIGNTVKLLELLAPETWDDKNPQHYLDILNRQTGTLRGLVDELLDVSRITRGLVELKQQRVNLIDVAQRALQSVQPILDEKHHDIRVTFPHKSVEVIGDPVRLEQVVANLLTNAAKYTDPGGRIALCLEQHQQTAELKVIDTGIGMSREVLDRIFDLFGQAERGLARSEGGLGIGLTIVKNLVELHGGQVAARSEGPGQGSEFYITLPLANAEKPAPAPQKQAAKAAIRSKRVLVVEDSPDIAETMALLLEAGGHTVATAHDGPSALATADEFKADIILLDIGLPGMNGYEVARRLRKNPHTQNAVLAALTGYGQAEDIERSHQAGFEKHFTKPVDIASLEEFINEVGRERGTTGTD